MDCPDMTRSNKFENGSQNSGIGEVKNISVLYVDTTRDAQSQFSNGACESSTPHKYLQKDARRVRCAAPRQDGGAPRGPAESARQSALGLRISSYATWRGVARQTGRRPSSTSVSMLSRETIEIPWIMATA